MIFCHKGKSMRREFLCCFLLCLFFLTFISGCYTKNESYQLEPTNDFLMNVEKKCKEVDSQVEDTNKSIEIRVMEMAENTLKPDSNIYFWVENTTDEVIRFPADMNVQIHQCINGIWNEVQYDGNYVGDSFDLSETSFFSTLTGFEVKPILTIIEEENFIRIFIKGEIVKNDQPTGEIVAAYTYFVIRP